MDRIDFLDGWRGLAIGMVLVAHFSPVPQMDFGRFGVDLFFVLSGLLMARILFEKRTPIPEFYRRRISRILPGFVAFLTIVLGAEALRGVKVTASEVLSLATFTRTYIGEFMWSDPLPVAQIWSLNVEEHCYLVLSLVAAIAMLFKRAALVLLALALATFPAIVIYHHLSTDPSSAYML